MPAAGCCAICSGCRFAMASPGVLPPALRTVPAAIDSMSSKAPRADYGIDAPGVIRNLLVIGGICLSLGLLGPSSVQLGSVNILGLRSLFLWPAGWLLA